MQERIENKKLAHSIEDEINKIIGILNAARFEHKKVIYSKKDVLLTISGLLLLGVCIPILYYGANNSSIKRNELDNYYEGERELLSALFRNWLFEDNGNGTCLDNYSFLWNNEVASCPPSTKVTIEFCKQFLMNYCQSLAEYNAGKASLPNDVQTIVPIVFGVFLLTGSIVLFSVLFGSDNSCITRKKQEPFSHPYIPKEYRNHIFNVAKYLSLAISDGEPLDKFIQALKERLNEIDSKRKCRLTFFFGKLERNNETDLYRFLKICDREVLYKILTYADPFLPHLKKVPYFPRNENEDNEHTPLLSETNLFHV